MQLLQAVRKLLTISGILLVNSTLAFAAANNCGADWKTSKLEAGCEMVGVSTSVTYPVSKLARPLKYKISAKLRAGMLVENADVTFKGNILYFEGLGDSMLNHRPLFDRLTSAGYRVIAFDYLGQGGSEGSMNDTRIVDLPKFGMQIYTLFARQNIAQTKPIIIGWSTGGLAAYYAAYLEMASKVILLAPGIVPKLMAGEQHLLRFKLNQITSASLTTARYSAENLDPHIDPIKPGSPLAVPDFAADLVLAAHYAHSLKIPEKVSGIVLLSGKHDTYVDGEATEKVLLKEARQFAVIHYPNALHEIDNEAPLTRALVQTDILDFLAR